MFKPGKKSDAYTGGASVAQSDQRLAMYIVISKPKRKSVKAGVVHCMRELLLVVNLIKTAFTFQHEYSTINNAITEPISNSAPAP